MAMKQGDSEKIWASIRKSGVPLELKVYETVSELEGWEADPGQYYVDSDDDKGREFDLKAGKDVGTSNENFLLTLNLVVECKSIPGHAWVFFPIKEQFGFLPSISLVEERQRERPSRVLAPFDLMPLGGAEGCRHCHEAQVDPSKSNWKQDKKGPDNIFEAKTTLVKATEFLRRKRIKELMEFVQDTKALDQDQSIRRALYHVASRIEIFQPLIVFDGGLYTARARDEDSLEEVNQVKYLVEYQSRNYEVSYLPIDICRADFLPEYLRQTESRLQAARTAAQEKMEDGRTWAESHKAQVVEIIQNLRLAPS